MQSQKRTNRSKKAQMTIEMISVAVIVVALLLLVFITTSNRNMETERILTSGKNSIQCNAIASVIARLYNNRATTQETLNLETEARLRRVEGNIGGINVGEIACNYIGSAEMYPADGTRDTDPGGTGETGITLEVRNWCFEKNPDTNIVLTPGECT